MRGFEICSGVLNIKPISSLMKCKYFGESLNWITEREKEWGRRGRRGRWGSRFIISSVHLSDGRDFGRPGAAGRGMGWGRGGVYAEAPARGRCSAHPWVSAGEGEGGGEGRPEPPTSPNTQR